MPPVLIVRRERRGDEASIAKVHRRAFGNGSSDEPAEVQLVAALRSSEAWLPKLSLVAVEGGDIVGHVLCTRGSIGSKEVPALGLAPIGVDPGRQGRGVGSALMHSAIAAAEALDERLIVLLGDGAYYGRFGFEPADRYGVTPPDPGWAPHFHLRPLAPFDTDLQGRFRYAAAFEAV